MLQRFIKAVGGDPHKKELEKLTEIVMRINALEPDLEKLSDEALRAKTDEFRARIASALAGITDENQRRLAEQAALDALLPEAFAVVREASKRTIGLRHYDVQLIGGIILHQGKIAEMRTGEGKTLVATLPLYLNALTGRGVHLVTVNDYLARRDARWMGAIYHFLGLKVGILQMAAVTENGKKAFLYDPEREHPREDQNQMRMVDRVEAYAADITYGTNSEFGFDYLRDNMTYSLADRVQRGHYYAIVDEVDNVLIDEARTPLIISGPASEDVEWYGKMAALVRKLNEEDYEINEKDRTVSLTEIGLAHVEQLLGQPLRDPDRPEDVTPEQARLLGYLEQALRAQHLFKRNKDYIVQAGKVVIVDEFTGRLMPGRRWSDGLHQAVEAKEGVKVEPENVTYATITLQNYFRMYQKLAGMTGTALTEAEEFHKIYKLEVLPVPTNLEYQAFGPHATLVEIKAKDEEGYEYAYFARRDDPTKTPLFWRRKDYPDVVFRTAEAKLRAIVREILREHVRGRPLLVGTTSVESSERLSGRLRAESVRRLAQVMLIRHAWLEANNRIEDGRAIPVLQPLNKPLDELRPEDLRPMAKELGLSLNPEDPANLKRLLTILNLSEVDEARLKAVLQGGIPHQVLNARKHAEESQIIARAGAFGAVTIATNMAGRGVDIKLGGELAEEVLNAVNRVLGEAGYKDPYDMTLQERRRALQNLDPAAPGIYKTKYEAEVRYFLQYFEDMERVRELGGLMVIGSERHEARRIDNQLRGRAARQGDPGASRFFLSLEDDLMRMFGGDQVRNLMTRFNIDDDFPLQARLVNNMIEQSQHRVEGANFDMRKHLLEYDDVLNAQRLRIYAQRDRVFQKENLAEDVEELLRAEVERRVADAASSEEYWRLLAWLDQIQPPLQASGRIFPSFTLQLMLEELSPAGADLESAALRLAESAIDAMHEHFLAWAFQQLDRAEETFKSQSDERLEALDAFLDSLKDRDETDPLRPQQAVEELAAAIRLPVRLSNEQAAQLVKDLAALRKSLQSAITTSLTAVTLARLLANLEFRLGESLGLAVPDLQALGWKEAANRIEERLRAALNERRLRLVGPEGQIRRDVQSFLERHPGTDEQTALALLMSMAQGARLAFDQKTHKQVRQLFTRLSYIYYGGELLRRFDTPALQEKVLAHLQQARQALFDSIREAEASRLGLPVTSPQVTEAAERLQNQVYRQVLLGAITELWVDYLTHVEALRVSVGLEAYAQRDPLVQYKSQASEMFQTLLADIRSTVISRIFLIRPRTAAVNVEVAEPSPVETSGGAKVGPEAQKDARDAAKKRKRHRH